MRYVTAIVLAAGKGRRFSRPNSFTVKGGIPAHVSKMIESGQSKVPKILVEINSKPVIINSLRILSKHPFIKDIIIVGNSKNLKILTDKIRQFRIAKVRKILPGGKRRKDSVYCGLKAVNNDAEFVLIHDAVRPFIDKDMVSSVIKEAEHSGAAILGVPVKATIKKLKAQSSKLKTKFIVEKTLKRNNLWEIQTPQVFRKDLILNAYKKFGNINATDDAMLVEKLGIKVSVVLGSYDNIKITTPEDLVIARTIWKCRNR
jgi:2-C-methyl-D-erythritol 4-phosphate cytidylyltransferase